MVKRCIYCKCNIEESSVIDFCDRCGVEVWGSKMLTVIKSGMEASRERGDLDQGHVY